MYLQGVNSRIVARQLCLGQRGMDFVMANLMQQDGRSTLPTFQFWDKVMQALPRVSGNGPATQGAYGQIRLYLLILWSLQGKRMTLLVQITRGCDGLGKPT